MGKDNLYCVITVVYNDVFNIEKTIRSVISQKMKFEYIIIDGGSNDGTVEIIKQYASAISYWISEKDKGVYDAMNKGVSYATSDWVCFMNSGDTFYDENVLNRIAPLLGSNCDIIYGDTNCIYDFGRFVVKAKPSKYLKLNMPFCHQSSFTRRLILLQHPFDLSFKYVADYHFFYKGYCRLLSFKKVDFTIANFDAVSGISSRNKIEVFDELLRVRKGNDSFLNRISLRFILFKYLLAERFKSRYPVLINYIRKHTLTGFKL